MHRGDKIITSKLSRIHLLTTDRFHRINLHSQVYTLKIFLNRFNKHLSQNNYIVIKLTSD